MISAPGGGGTSRRVRASGSRWQTGRLASSSRSDSTEAVDIVKTIVRPASLALVLAALTACQAGRGAAVATPMTAGATATLAMKGYELYSWQAGGEWCFSLVLGTNRLKTYQEVKADTVAVKGLDSIQARLEQLPRGEQVFWVKQGVPGMSLPPDAIIEQIKQLCGRLGISIAVVR